MRQRNVTAAFDLRLLGAARRLPLDGVAAFLLPWARTGFALMAASGLLLFAANATTMITGLFATKLTAIAGAFLAGAATAGVPA